VKRAAKWDNGRRRSEEYGGAGLDKISTTVLTEKLSIYGGFAVTHGAHAGMARCNCYFGTEEQKKKYLPKLGHRPVDRRVLAFRTASGIGRAEFADARGIERRRNSLYFERAEVWITNGGFADCYIVFAKVTARSSRVHRRAHVLRFKPGNEEHKMGIHAARRRDFPGKTAKCRKKICCTKIGRGHIVAFNILNAGRFTLGASCVGDRSTCS